MIAVPVNAGRMNEQSDSLEGEGRTGTVTQESFEPSTVTGRDVDRGIDAEPAGGLPREHVIGDVPFEATKSVESP